MTVNNYKAFVNTIPTNTEKEFLHCRLLFSRASTQLFVLLQSPNCVQISEDDASTAYLYTSAPPQEAMEFVCY